jgi:hypothetical protein
VDDRQPQKQQQVCEIQRIATVREHTRINQRIRPHLTVLPAACDVDETDHQDPEDLAAERDKNADGVDEMIAGDRAAYEPWNSAKRDGQQYGREQPVPDAEDDIAGTLEERAPVT